jgi:hypothetical protein
MRSRFLICILIIAAAIFEIIFYFHPSKKMVIPNTNQSLPQPADVSQRVTNVKNAVDILSNSQQVNLSPTSPRTLVSDKDKMAELFQKYKEGIPVEFYGQFIDQDSNPLPEVKVSVSIQRTYMLSSTEFVISNDIVRLEKTTGADGRFEINNEKGESVDIDSIQKAGYEIEPNEQRGFGSSSGSFNNPVIFKMWSDKIHEQLITGNKSFEIVPDGRPHFINLTDGTISESVGGDLKVWIQYTNQVTRGQLYDWSAGIEVVNGGLLEVQQAAINSGFWPDPPFAMYSAPIDGYIPSFSLKNQIKGDQSGEIGNRYFYLLLNNGKEYGRMSINLFAPYGHLHPGLIRLSYALNPSGSRILR